ncbi:MAG: virulence RhuM family protein [Candidatus Marinimicrobia bacterium]|nr:virulence RhuM family protein [Candidatus Neomarinimicrobiota bacterium]
MAHNSEILIYQTEDGKTKIQTRLENETVWLTQEQISVLFQRERSVITKHISNVFRENELEEESNVHILHISGTDRPVKFYNLDVIISVGYRVKSHRGVQFRKWATARVKEYLVKGFTMNDELLKESGGGKYFEELLERIRDIRSSEKVFYRKVLEIYATSIDYDPGVETTRLFFQTVQNKLHWAAHGHTAAEVIFKRANAQLPFMGLTSFKGDKPVRQEITIAKNYLSKQEISILNRLVSAYLDIAEVNAMQQKTMTMNEWIEVLDGFITMSRQDILTHAGKISAELAQQKALSEYENYNKKSINEFSEVEKQFLESIETTRKKLEEKKK